MTLSAAFAPPAPNVLKKIRAELKKRRMTHLDRRLPGVEAEIAAEPYEMSGLNEGIFYPEAGVPGRLARLAPRLAVRKRPTTGTVKLLVLLVDFSDNKGARSAATFKKMLFSKGTYPTGSMWDFYDESSYGQLDVQGEVHGWLRLPKPYSYYVNGKNGTGVYPTNAQRMTQDALQIAAQTLDFSDFDDDGDGFVDGLFIVHAGGGAEAEPDTAKRAKKIWAHQANLPTPFTSNGVSIYSYLTVPEDCRVGVCCHEFGHMLGLPDLYDTTNRSEGVGAWCVMGSGSWNKGGLRPAHFCAWAKAQLNWLKPTVVKSTKALTLLAAETSKSSVVRLWTRGKAGDEYFLIENRQLVGFDKDLPGSGLLVWRIDDANHNNDHPGDYWVGLMQADGKSDLEMARNDGDHGDPFPGTARNTTFDVNTLPNSRDHLGRPTHVSIKKIATKAGKITCQTKV